MWTMYSELERHKAIQKKYYATVIEKNYFIVCVTKFYVRRTIKTYKPTRPRKLEIDTTNILAT